MISRLMRWFRRSPPGCEFCRGSAVACYEPDEIYVCIMHLDKDPGGFRELRDLNSDDYRG